MKIPGQLRFLYLVTFYLSSAYACSDDEFSSSKTLSSVSVAFRHGDRTPEPYPEGFYANDPYKNDPMEPMGHGGLTNRGKLREYETGLKLRERYQGFLSDIYKPQDISVISTDYERTKMSLSLVLAGLYPPKGVQVWRNSLNWQPIPIKWVPKTVHGIIKGFECPTYKNELNTVLGSEDYQKDLSQFDELMKNLTSLTGDEVKGSKIILNLYHTFIAEKGMGLELPKWTEDYYPDGVMKKASLFDYRTRSYTTKLKKLDGGILIRKMLNDLLYNDKNLNKKIHLNSLHDTTNAALLSSLKLTINDIPAYGSAVIFELHKCDNKQYLKIVYYNSIPPTFETRTIPGCSEYCLVEDFLNILKDVIPDDAIEACFGPPNDSLLIPKSENAVEWIYGKIREWYDA